MTISGGLVMLNTQLSGTIYTGKFDTQDFVYVQDGMKCELAGNKPTQQPLKCIEGDIQKNTIYIFGDSHASNLVHIVENAIEGTSYDNVKYLTNQAEFVQGKESLRGTNWYEDKDIDKILSQMSKDDVLLWSRRQTKMADDLAEVESQLSYIERLARKTGTSVLIVDDIVDFGGDHNFYPKFSLLGNGPSLDINEASKNRKTFTEKLKRYSDNNQLVYYFDPLLSFVQTICAPLLSKANFCMPTGRHTSPRTMQPKNSFHIQ